MVCAVCSLGPTLVAWYTAAGMPWVSPATSSQPPSIEAERDRGPGGGVPPADRHEDQVATASAGGEDLQEPEDRLDHRALGGVEADVRLPRPCRCCVLVARW